MDPKNVRTIRIIATNDIHGKFCPWNYETDQEDLSGSMAQLYTAVRELRDENTLVIDAGDVIQGNSANLFTEEPVHPMALCMNMIGYDFWVTGNHDYDYGSEPLRRMIDSLEAKTLTGNVYLPDGTPLADSCSVIEKNGIRIGLIGMTTAVIAESYAVKKSGLVIADPLKKTREAVNRIKGETDVLIGVFHMGLGHMINENDSSVLDVRELCPEFDIIIASHEHQIIESRFEGSTLITQNEDQAKSLSLITLTFGESDGKYVLTDKQAHTFLMKDYAPDPSMMSAMETYDRTAKADAETPIGTLTGGPLAGIGTDGLPEAILRSTPLMNFLSEVVLYYSGASVSAIALTDEDTNLMPGPFNKSAASDLSKFANHIVLLQMTGRQLRRYTEWSASYFLTCASENEPIRTDPGKEIFMYDIFGGLNYEIVISNEPGNRIRNLTYSDGRPVGDEDVINVAVTHFRAYHFLLSEDGLFEGEPLPVLLDDFVHEEIGTIRDMIPEYIRTVKNGRIEADHSLHWQVVRF